MKYIRTALLLAVQLILISVCLIVATATRCWADPATDKSEFAVQEMTEKSLQCSAVYGSVLECFMRSNSVAQIDPQTLLNLKK